MASPLSHDLRQTTRRQHLFAMVLASARDLLEMDVAFVSRFRQDDRVLEQVDAARDDAPVSTGQVLSLDTGYCRRIVEGRLPELIADTQALPAAVALPETAAMPIGAHLGVPIRLRGGRLYGSFCCFSHRPQPSLGERELRLMRTFGQLLGAAIEQDDDAPSPDVRSATRIAETLADDGPAMRFQPIVEAQSRQIVGFECLARFANAPGATPADAWSTEQWFREARRAGLGDPLESAAIRQAIAPLRRFREQTFLAVNCTVEMVLGGGVARQFHGTPCERIVLELTEHERVDDYLALRAALAPLRDAGMRLAIDDVGAGHASLRHVLELKPDAIKLDTSLTHGLQSSSAKRSLVTALRGFAHGSEAILIAEGVEHEAEVAALTQLGVDFLQGYLLGRPVDVDEALRWDADGARR